MPVVCSPLALWGKRITVTSPFPCGQVLIMGCHQTGTGVSYRRDDNDWWRHQPCGLSAPVYLARGMLYDMPLSFLRGPWGR